MLEKYHNIAVYYSNTVNEEKKLKQKIQINFIMKVKIIYLLKL